jgi:hypothetical protein
MTEECVVELTWWRTWPDRQFDFSAADGDLRVGRVTMVGERGNKWQWYMYALVGKRHATVSGLADDREEACRAVEDSYRAFRERVGMGTWPGGRTPPQTRTSRVDQSNA